MKTTKTAKKLIDRKTLKQVQGGADKKGYEYDVYVD